MKAATKYIYMCHGTSKLMVDGTLPIIEVEFPLAMVLIQLMVCQCAKFMDNNAKDFSL